MAEVSTGEPIEGFKGEFYPRWERAWSSGDPNEMARLPTEDVILRSTDVPETSHGRAEGLGT
jgi:hypothetical protein